MINLSYVALIFGRAAMILIGDTQNWGCRLDVASV